MKPFIFAILASMLIQGGGAINISTQNPSFEQGMAGWVVTPIRAYDGNYGDAKSVQWTGAPDGLYVASIENATISQDLGIVPQSGIYTMQVYFANWFYPYPANYTATIMIGGKPFCTVSSGTALGDWTTIPLVCPISNYVSTYHNGWSGNLGISFTTTGPWWPLLVDEVSLTFTPTN